MTGYSRRHDFLSIRKMLRLGGGKHTVLNNILQTANLLLMHIKISIKNVFKWLQTWHEEQINVLTSKLLQSSKTMQKSPTSKQPLGNPNL